MRGVFVSDRVPKIGAIPLRCPDSFEGLQVNGCRNPACSNVGLPASPYPSKAGQNDPYKIEKGGKVLPDRIMLCKACRRSFMLKSNKGVAAELRRISHYLDASAEPSCPNGDCANHGRGVYSARGAYRARGARSGMRRYLCKACDVHFSVPERSTCRQRAPHENRTVFVEIVTKKPIRGIAQVTGLDAATVYSKIDFIHRQCLAFAGDRERRLEDIDHHSLRLCVDSQDYMVNWRRRVNRKNIQFTAVCTVEAASGYVLAHNMNFDPDMMQVDVEDEARINGDLDPKKKSYFRTSPQYWLEHDFRKQAGAAPLEIRPNIDAEPLLVEQLIIEKALLEASMPDPEIQDAPFRGNQMPHAGVMTHADYTAYAHAMLVERMTRGAKYATIYTDQSTMLRNAFTAAFADRIRKGRCEMAFVQFQKEMTIDEKRDLARASGAQMKRLTAAFGVSEPQAAARAMAWGYATACAGTNDPNIRWIAHPRDTLNEPRQWILYLTDNRRRSLEGIGWAISLATLAPVDNYFMRLRRKVYYLERPVPTRSNAKRLWSGYQAYDPRRVAQMLDIFRVYTNFVWQASNGETPAMRLGLARGPVRFEDILYWMPNFEKARSGDGARDNVTPMAAE